MGSNGRGVDIILDCIGGSYSEGNLASLATDGRWVVYGLMGGAEVSGPVLGGVLRKRASVIGTTLRSRSDDYKAQLAAAFARWEICIVARRTIYKFPDIGDNQDIIS